MGPLSILLAHLFFPAPFPADMGWKMRRGIYNTVKLAYFLVFLMLAVIHLVAVYLGRPYLHYVYPFWAYFIFNLLYHRIMGMGEKEIYSLRDHIISTVLLAAVILFLDFSLSPLIAPFGFLTKIFLSIFLGILIGGIALYLLTVQEKLLWEEGRIEPLKERTREIGIRLDRKKRELIQQSKDIGERFVEKNLASFVASIYEELSWLVREMAFLNEILYLNFLMMRKKDLKGRARLIHVSTIFAGMMAGLLGVLLSNIFFLFSF